MIRLGGGFRLIVLFWSLYGVAWTPATAQPAQDPKVQQRLASYAEALDGTIREIRQTIFSLRAAEEKGDGLRHEVLWIPQEAAEVLSFEPSVQFNGPVDSAVPTAVAGQVVSMLREALTNIGRHAVASSAEVELAVTVRRCG